MWMEIPMLLTNACRTCARAADAFAQTVATQPNCYDDVSDFFAP